MVYSIKKILFILLIILFILLKNASSAQGVTENPAYREARGPLSIRNMRPYNLLFLQFTPESGDVLNPGGARYGLQLDVSNNLLVPDSFGQARVIEDNE